MLRVLRDCLLFNIAIPGDSVANHQCSDVICMVFKDGVQCPETVKGGEGRDGDGKALERELGLLDFGVFASVRDALPATFLF